MLFAPGIDLLVIRQCRAKSRLMALTTTRTKMSVAEIAPHGRFSTRC